MPEKNEKRKAIIDAAIHIFSRVGFEAASMAEIAELAGVAKGTLYLYFTSKEQLVEAAYHKCNRENVEACDAGLEQITGAPEKLYQRLRNAVNWALAYPEMQQITLLYSHQPHMGVRARYPSKTLHFESVDAILREGVERGEVKLMPTPLLGEMFFGIGAAALYYLMDNPDQMQNEQFWADIRESVYGCVQRVKTGEE